MYSMCILPVLKISAARYYLKSIDFEKYVRDLVLNLTKNSVVMAVLWKEIYNMLPIGAKCLP